MAGPTPDRGLGRGLWLRFRALRAFSFPLTVLPVVVATAAVRPFADWDWGILMASAVGVMLLNAAGDLLNDYFDYRSGVDRRLEGDEARPGRYLVRGELAPRDVLVEALLCLLLAAPFAAHLLWRCGPGLLWFGAPAILAAYAYTGPPLHLKYRALGELLIFVVLGPVLLAGAAYAQVGRCPASVLLLSVPVGLVTTGVLLGNNMRDGDEDAAAGIRTLAHMLGLRGVRAVYALSLLAPPLMVAGIAAAGMVPAGALACSVSLLPAYLVLRRALAGRRVPDIDALTARFALVFMLALGVGLAV
jgi:1,4-dihydroxy-2-naphthoate octaprenyltransferase